jgi:hypothetical protein
MSTSLGKRGSIIAYNKVVLAYTDGYMYFYSGGKWNPFGVKWK